MLSVDCRISGHHPAQGPARQAERQRGDKMGRAAGEALVHRQGDDGQDGEIEKAVFIIFPSRKPPRKQETT